MLTLDTSALIRFFTNDIPEKAQEVKKIIESKEKIIIPDVVFPELEYVLFGKSYNATRAKILKAFEFLATQKNIIVSKEAKKAIEIYKATKLDIADCIIVASSLKNKLFSFDKQLLKVKGVKSF
jgi:predicted nucleic-acid-binding protein